MTFEEFLRAEMTGLTRFSGALCGDRHLAEDVLADALLVASTRWNRISGMEHPLAYVRRIVLTTFLSESRKAGRRRTEATCDPAVLEHPDADAYEAVDRRDQVRRLLSTLAPQQRAAVVLRYLLDQTDDEMADVLGCSPATVRSHLSHARSALRLTAGADRRGF
jgi:RNA polymerase sigma-70 factor (sigma-E family)